MKKILLLLAVLLLPLSSQAAQTHVTGGVGVTWLSQYTILNSNMDDVDERLDTIEAWSGAGDLLTWATATTYAENALVKDGTHIFYCKVAHTSGDHDDEPGTGAVWSTYWGYSGEDLYEPLKGADDNYVTDAEKAALFFPTGIASGFTLSINADPEKIDIAAGVGYLANSPTPISYGGVTGLVLTYRASSIITYIAIEADLDIIQQTTPFTPTQRRTMIPLGAAIHSNLSTVNGINNLPDVATDINAQFNDLLDSLKEFNVSGNIISPNGANLNVNKSAGTVFKKGSNFSTATTNPHIITTGALTAPATMRYRLQDGTEYSNTAVIDPDNWDNAGVLTSVPSNKYTIQRFTLFTSNLIRVQYGQNTYNSMSEAIQAISTETFVIESNIESNGLLRAVLVVKEGATELNNENEAQFFAADKFGIVGNSVVGTSTTTIQQAYNNGLEPEILTSATRGSLALQRGSAADTDSIIDVLNGAGDTTFSVKGNGQAVSAIATGAAPFVIASTTEVANLHAATASNSTNWGGYGLPADPGADRWLMWDDSETGSELVWSDSVGTDEIVYQSDCTSPAVTNGFCIDTDDGNLFYYNNSALVGLYASGGDGTYGISTKNNTATYAPQSGFDSGFSVVANNPYVYADSTLSRLQLYSANLAAWSAISPTTGDIATTGVLSGAIVTATDADAHTLTSSEYHGGSVLATGAGVYTLPAAAAGLSGCVEAGQGVTAVIQLLPASGDYIVYHGVRGTAATALASGGEAGDKICYIAYDTDDWYVSTYGTWAE